MELLPSRGLSVQDTLRWSRDFLRPMWEQFAHLRDLQQLYEKCQHQQGLAFIEQLLLHLRITVRYNAAELQRLPAGAFVVVANHPCGLLDGIVLLHVLGKARPDLRAVANDLLAPLLPQLASQLILVSPERAAAGRNVPGVRRLLRHLHNDVPLLLFPAGEVAHSTNPFRTATDSEWNPTAGRLLQAARVPVVPVWLSGQNSPGFSLLGFMHPLLRTARLPAELFNKRGQTIQVRIGQPVGPTVLDRLPAPDRLAYLRARVYALGTAAERDEAALLPPLPTPPVTTETAPALIEADIAALRASRCLLVNGRWEVYVAKRAEIPNVLREIGRLRELTFRRVGEGTQQPTDLDKYDDYYRHLFLYDRENQRLVGAYRLGLGRAILRQYGRRGFYLHSLFKLSRELTPVLRQSLELGRSFIRPEYQRQPLPLALLWEGIAEYMLAHPEYRYLMGPVSISNQFSSVSKAVMVEYLTRHFFDAQLAAHVRPRKQFQYKPLDGNNAAVLLQTGLTSLQELQQLICGLEPGGAGVPVLLRQYLKQNARLLGFNLDPNFSNCLDGFLLLDARTLPARMHRMGRK
ncbi:lysophospholipid acyltransferase family protein [Hymenobacter sp. BT186]|uniref:Lysophospholipid acyltransferase family protein n=1 Tax=Hymenobacter telluris TaxID=2816474 RepID=A0A939ETJ5_9BACT|nr:lysophospholipid acyltransferase family protein [Hymenobacter telluris]MBO0356884.1 lysophospholipid acyltransferase family protein [Hymenobacter telluris]MBW3372911.1 lysophospholipid acyltransferase family protein [Hymenobacter norwichensis]